MSVENFIPVHRIDPRKFQSIELGKINKHEGTQYIIASFQKSLSFSHSLQLSFFSPQQYLVAVTGTAFQYIKTLSCGDCLTSVKRYYGESL